MYLAAPHGSHLDVSSQLPFFLSRDFPGIEFENEKELLHDSKNFSLVSSAAFLLMAARPAISAAGERNRAAATDDGATSKALVAIAGAGDMESHTTRTSKN